MVAFLALVFLIAQETQSLDVTPCDGVFNKMLFTGILVRDCSFHQGSVYWRLEYRMSWEMARQACQNYPGGELVSIHNFDEKRLVNSMAENNYVNVHDQKDHWNGVDQGVWIGLVDTNPGNKNLTAWKWSDGSKLDYEDWLSTQPDFHAKKEHCVQLTNYLRNGGTLAFGWNDIGCKWGLKAICKAPSFN